MLSGEFLRALHLSPDVGEMGDKKKDKELKDVGEMADKRKDKESKDLKGKKSKDKSYYRPVRCL